LLNPSTFWLQKTGRGNPFSVNIFNVSAKILLTIKTPAIVEPGL